MVIKLYSKGSFQFPSFFIFVLSIYPSIYPSIHPSIFLSIWLLLITQMYKIEGLLLKPKKETYNSIVLQWELPQFH